MNEASETNEVFLIDGKVIVEAGLLSGVRSSLENDCLGFLRAGGTFVANIMIARIAAPKLRFLYNTGISIFIFTAWWGRSIFYRR